MRKHVVAILAVLLALPLFACGDPYEDGSEPSGSVLRVMTVTSVGDAETPDLYLSACAPSETGEFTYESGLTNAYVDVRLRNEDRPNTPAGQSTNSFVTMTRFRVDFTGLNRTVSLPSIDGGGSTVGIPPDSEGTMRVLVLDFATMDLIRARYPNIGNGESLTLRANITMWGEDAFGASVKAEALFTMAIDNYDRC